MNKLGFRIFTKIERPSEELVNSYKNIPVANIADNMERISCIDAAIKPFNKRKILGTAFTVKGPGGDNLMFHKAIDMAVKGDVIVVSESCYTSRSLCGEIMMKEGQMKKLGGFLIDGFIRDVEAARSIDFPVYARGVNPNGPYKNGPGEINVPVSIGGQVVFPGDIIVGDEDGVIILKPEDAKILLKKVKEFNNSEIELLKDMEKGIELDNTWIDEILKEKNCEII